MASIDYGASNVYGSDDRNLDTLASDTNEGGGLWIFGSEDSMKRERATAVIDDGDSDRSTHLGGLVKATVAAVRAMGRRMSLAQSLMSSKSVKERRARERAAAIERAHERESVDLEAGAAESRKSVGQEGGARGSRASRLDGVRGNNALMKERMVDSPESSSVDLADLPIASVNGSARGYSGDSRSFEAGKVENGDNVIEDSRTQRQKPNSPAPLPVAQMQSIAPGRNLPPLERPVVQQPSPALDRPALPKIILVNPEEDAQSLVSSVPTAPPSPMTPQLPRLDTSAPPIIVIGEDSDTTNGQPTPILVIEPNTGTSQFTLPESPVPVLITGPDDEEHAPKPRPLPRESISLSQRRETLPPAEVDAETQQREEEKANEITRAFEGWVDPFQPPPPATLDLDTYTSAYPSHHVYTSDPGSDLESDVSGSEYGGDGGYGFTSNPNMRASDIDLRITRSYENVSPFTVEKMGVTRRMSVFSAGMSVFSEGSSISALSVGRGRAFSDEGLDLGSGDVGGGGLIHAAQQGGAGKAEGGDKVQYTGAQDAAQARKKMYARLHTLTGANGGRESAVSREEEPFGALGREDRDGLQGADVGREDASPTGETENVMSTTIDSRSQPLQTSSSLTPNSSMPFSNSRTQFRARRNALPKSRPVLPPNRAHNPTTLFILQDAAEMFVEYTVILLGGMHHFIFHTMMESTENGEVARDWRDFAGYCAIRVAVMLAVALLGDFLVFWVIEGMQGEALSY
ncbi:hypothetical protein HDV00_002855 [Rhizophlyctis rosea]|nr:hypothetical protein HDV00_002855 [Rhizophlyctis rosea]